MFDAHSQTRNEYEGKAYEWWEVSASETLHKCTLSRQEINYTGAAENVTKSTAHTRTRTAHNKCVAIYHRRYPNVWRKATARNELKIRTISGSIGDDTHSVDLLGLFLPHAYETTKK